MYVSTKAQTVVTNGTFNTNLTGWAVTSNGGTSGFPWSWTSYNGGFVITTQDNGSTELSQFVNNVPSFA